MSLQSLFQISRRSLRSLDAAMNVVGQNVANANSDGYKRRRVTMQADSLYTQGLQVGSYRQLSTGAGVSIQSYERLKDSMLQRASWEAQSGLGSAYEEQRVLGTLETLFPKGAGSLEDQLGAFWDSWNDLANNPNENSTRTALVSQSQALTNTFNQLDRDIQRLTDETTVSLSDGIDDVNELLTEVADLNVRIQNSRFNGTPDFAAEDRRDVLITELSEFLPITVQPEGDLGYTVNVGGVTIVDGANAMELSMSTPGPQVFLNEPDIEFTANPSGGDGKIGAWLRSLTTTLPDANNRLDEIAQTLATEVNALHQTGFGLDGVGGRDFFDPASVSASSIALDAGILANVNTIGASASATAEGDSSIALAIFELQNATLLDGNTTTIGNASINLVSGIGNEAAEALQYADSQAILVDQLEGIERGVSGVNIDEEMSMMIELQQAYAASARILTTAQSMFDTLLRL